MNSGKPARRGFVLLERVSRVGNKRLGHQIHLIIRYTYDSKAGDASPAQPDGVWGQTVALGGGIALAGIGWSLLVAIMCAIYFN